MSNATDERKHTPGPWEVDETKALGAYGVWTGYVTHPGFDGDGYPTMICDVRPMGKDVSREERDANARLIAASPDLLSSLRNIREVLSYVMAKAPGYDWNADVLRLTLLTGKAFAEAEAAIARATGG